MVELISTIKVDIRLKIGRKSIEKIQVEKI